MTECLLHSQALLGEGPSWLKDRGELLWVDILKREIHRYHLESGKDFVVQVDDLISAVVPGQGELAVGAFKKGLGWVHLETGAIQWIHHPESSVPGNRFNDGKCDPRGRFWAGTMDMVVENPVGNLYCLGADLSLQKKESELLISNGLGWSPDHQTMYFTDSPRREIYAYDFDIETGTISHRRVFAKIPEDAGVPDGLCVDAEGGVWSAHWGGWRVTKYNPLGEIEQEIQVPVPQPTSCCLGGEDLKTLFITSAREGLSDKDLVEAPLSGDLFACQVDVPGVLEVPFQGKPL